MHQDTIQEPSKSPGSSCWHCVAPPAALLHDGCPDSTGMRIGSAAESQAFGNQPDDLAARAGAGNHVAARTSRRAPVSDGMGSDPFLSVQRPGRYASRCDGQRTEHTSCFRPEPACSTARSERSSNPGIPGSSTRHTQIRQWNEQLLDLGDSGGSLLVPDPQGAGDRQELGRGVANNLEILP